MKKFLALGALTLIICSMLFARERINGGTEEYCEVRTSTKLLKNRSTAHVDYGEGDLPLKDEQGKTKEFGSSIGALNYMNTQGWELVNSRIDVAEGYSYTYYMMKRRMNN